jgi:hypothetical protein
MTREQWTALCERSYQLQRRLKAALPREKEIIFAECRAIRRMMDRYSNRYPTQAPVTIPRPIALRLPAA